MPTRGIAKLLITGQAGTKDERTFVGRLGLIAARYGLSVAALTQSYLQWRDANLLVLGQEVNRLRTPPAIAAEAMAIIRSVADSGWFARHGRTNVRWISIQWRRIPETAFWRLGVADIGIGFTDKSSELVFQRTVRIDPNDSRRSGGAGLGLAIARALVNMHRGEVGVQSPAGFMSTSSGPWTRQASRHPPPGPAGR